MEEILQQLLKAWDGIDKIGQWANEHVLAAMVLGYLFVRVAGYVVKVTPNKYDDLCFDMIVDAVKAAYEKARSTGKAK